MSKLFVDHAGLIELSKFLYEKSQEFEDLIKKMDSTVENISNAWDGIDSQTFISNARSYINNLRIIELGLIRCSQDMNSHESRYLRALQKYLNS